MHDPIQYRTLKMLLSFGYFALLLGASLDFIPETRMGFAMAILGLGVGIGTHKFLMMKKEAEPFYAKFDKIPKYLSKLTRIEVYWHGFNDGGWRKQFEFDQAEKAKRKKEPDFKFL
jgi:hypothetical protein